MRVAEAFLEWTMLKVLMVLASRKQDEGPSPPRRMHDHGEERLLALQWRGRRGRALAELLAGAPLPGDGYADNRTSPER
jgi:hypothetical protein